MRLFVYNKIRLENKTNSYRFDLIEWMFGVWQRLPAFVLYHRPWYCCHTTATVSWIIEQIDFQFVLRRLRVPTLIFIIYRMWVDEKRGKLTEKKPVVWMINHKRTSWTRATLRVILLTRRFGGRAFVVGISHFLLNGIDSLGAFSH